MSEALNFEVWPCQNPALANPPVLIIHGLFGAAVNWSSYAQLWSQTHQVLGLELPAHGSSGAAADLPYAIMAERLAAALQAKNLAPLIVLGHSMGGKLAMMLALTHPELLARLIVVDMAPKLFSAKHDYVFAALASIPLSQLSSRSQGITLLNQALPDPMVAAFLAKSLLPPDAENPAWRWRFNLKALQEGYHHVGDWPAALTAVYEGPCLLIRGALSDYVLDADLPNFRRYFPQLECQTIAHAGHWVQAEQREAFLNSLKNWL